MVSPRAVSGDDMSSIASGASDDFESTGCCGNCCAPLANELRGCCGYRQSSLIFLSSILNAGILVAILAHEVVRLRIGGASVPFQSWATGGLEPWTCFGVYWASHLTPPLYAAPYILRALRLAVLFEPQLRLRYGFLQSTW